MTMEKLLELPAKDLEAMTDAELLEHFKGYLVVTRPELAEKPAHGPSIRRATNPSGSVRSSNGPSKKQQASDILKQFGINVKL
jgi:hypothetical protein